VINTTEYYQDNVTNRVTKWIPRVVIDYSDYNIDNTISVSNTFDGEGSFPDQIADGIKTPTFKYFTWADFEWGCHLMGDDDQYEHGAISQQISGADKTFPENKPAFYGTTFYSTEPSSLLSVYIPKPTFSVTFSERTVNSLEVIFDDKLVQYAEEFDVQIYQGDTLASTENVTGNTGTTWRKTLSSSIDDVTRLDLIINKWSVAETWARVVEFYTSVQETYDSGDILSFSVSEESAPDKATTPIGNVTANTCDIELVNRNSLFDNDNEDSPLQGNLVKNRRLMPYIGLDGDLDETGKQTYIPLGVFYSQNWNNNNYQLTASVDGRDIVQLMDENEYKKSQFISAPADQDEEWTTTADFDAFTKFNVISANNELQFAGGRYLYESTVNDLYGNTGFYGQTILSGNFYYGYAYKTFTYTWTEGSSVKFALEKNETKTAADRINYYLSFDGGTTYTQIIDTLTYYPATAGSTQTVYIKVEFITPSGSTALSVQDISLTISGYVSLLSLATKVLNDFDDETKILEGNYEINTELGDINIPNAYIEPQSYLDAMRMICQAGAARAFSARSGKFIIERVDKLADYELSRDNTSYFNAENKSNSQELINRVTVKVNPLTRASSDEVIAELSETAAASSVKTYTIFFETDPSDGVSFEILDSGVSVTDSTIYTWGAEVEVTNSNGTETDFTLTVEGRPYTVNGAFEVQLDDSESTRRNGVQELIIDNPLIQIEEQADDIAELLISSYSNQKRLVSADIVPDPALEISDGIAIDSKGYKVYNQEIEYSDSGLSHTLQGVKQ